LNQSRFLWCLPPLLHLVCLTHLENWFWRSTIHVSLMWNGRTWASALMRYFYGLRLKM
jgi:hypothetical protein